jgi:hypothetical protein
LIHSQLFSSYFLEESIRETEAWHALADDDAYLIVCGIFTAASGNLMQTKPAQKTI